MKIVNAHGLPAALVRVLEKDIRDTLPDRYSPSAITKSPRQYWLWRRHYHEIEVDAMDRVWAIFGSAVHTVLEKGEGANSLAESWLTTEINYGEGKATFCGIADNYEDGVISDWKVTSAWSVVFGDKPEWEVQLNAYAFLFREYGFTVHSIQNVLILRDFDKHKAGRDGYPATPMVTVPVKLWEYSMAREVITKTIRQLESYRDTAEDEIPDCTPEQKWARPTTYAVMKPGRKSAVRVFDDRAKADTLAETENNLSVVERPGKCTRCEEYCDVAKWCKYAPKVADEDSDY